NRSVAMPACDPTRRVLHVSGTWNSAQQGPDLVDRVRLGGRLVVPVAAHAGEAQRHTARIPGRDLHPVEGDLDDLLGPDVHDVGVTAGPATDLQLEEAGGLPPQQLVREP